MDYTGEMMHTPETIRRLSDLQYRAFRPGLRLIWLLMGGVCVIFAAQHSDNVLLFCLLMLPGCWLLLNQNLPAAHRADKLVAAAGGTLPYTGYQFRSDDFRVSSGGHKKTVAYKDLYALFEDRDYFYLFLNRQSGYMVERTSLADPEAWKTQLQKKSGKRFRKAGTARGGMLDFKKFFGKPLGKIR